MFHTYVNIFQAQTEPFTVAWTDGINHGLYTVADALMGEWTVMADMSSVASGEEADGWLSITLEHESMTAQLTKKHTCITEAEIVIHSKKEVVQFILGKTGIKLQNEQPSPLITYLIQSIRNEEGQCILIRITPLAKESVFS